MKRSRAIQTVQQIAKDFEVHPVQVSEWKKPMIEGATGVFGPSREKAAGEDFELQHADLHADLHAKIGQLTDEMDFLRIKPKQLGL